MEMGAMGTMGMGIRRGLGELGPFLFVFRRRAPVFGIQVRGLGDIVFLRALLDGLPLMLRRRIQWDLPVLYLSFATVGTILVG
jgi:Na+-translocating ferredoxin:NAD+ oxidoreductase RnfD subunit